jgi:putative DNA primase/helicase
VRAGGAIVNLQFIDPSGDKRFLTGGRTRGCYLELDGTEKRCIAIAEGLATAQSILECTGLITIAAFSAGNLLPVASAVRARHSGLMVICGDNDQKPGGNNPGREHATIAAHSVGARLAIPADPGDFNDVHQACGADAVARQIAAAITKGAK